MGRDPRARPALPRRPGGTASTSPTTSCPTRADATPPTATPSSAGRCSPRLAAAVPRVRLGDARVPATPTATRRCWPTSPPPSTTSAAAGCCSASAPAGRRTSTPPTASSCGTVKERLDRFEEACQVVLGLLREQRTTFDGALLPGDRRAERARSRCRSRCRCSSAAAARSARCASPPATPTSGTCGRRPSVLRPQGRRARPPLRGPRPRPGRDQRARPRRCCSCRPTRRGWPTSADRDIGRAGHRRHARPRCVDIVGRLRRRRRRRAHRPRLHDGLDAPAARTPATCSSNEVAATFR